MTTCRYDPGVSFESRRGGNSAHGRRVFGPVRQKCQIRRMTEARVRTRSHSRDSIRQVIRIVCLPTEPASGFQGHGRTWKIWTLDARGTDSSSKVLSLWTAGRAGSGLTCGCR